MAAWVDPEKAKQEGRRRSSIGRLERKHVDNPTAQGNGAHPTNGQPETGNQHEGLQKRIDELTANARQAEAAKSQAEARAAQLEQTTAELLTTIAAFQGPKAPAAEPLPEVDPDIQRHIEAATKPLLARIDQLAGTVVGRVQEIERREVAARIGDDEITARATALQKLYAKQGVNADFDTCVNIALGEKVRVDREKNAATDAARRKVNGGYTVLTQGGSPMTTTGGGPTAPANAHPASAYTPEALNRVGSRGFSAAKLAQELDAMPDLPLGAVVPRGG